jgi:hypothetical protein
MDLLMWGALSGEEVASVVFSCCWASSAQSFLGLSPAGLMIIFHCLNFRDSLNLEEEVKLRPIVCQTVLVSGYDRKLDLFPFSGGGGRYLLLLGPLQRADLNHWLQRCVWAKSCVL